MDNKHIENLINDPHNTSKLFMSTRGSKKYYFVEIANVKYSEKFAVLDEEVGVFNKMIDTANQNKIENKKRIKEERLFRLTRKLKDLEQSEISSDFNKEINKLDELDVKVEKNDEPNEADLEIEEEIEEEEEIKEEIKPSNEEKL